MIIIKLSKKLKRKRKILKVYLITNNYLVLVMTILYYRMIINLNILHNQTEQLKKRKMLKNQRSPKNLILTYVQKNLKMKISLAINLKKLNWYVQFQLNLRYI